MSSNKNTVRSASKSSKSPVRKPSAKSSAKGPAKSNPRNQGVRPKPLQPKSLQPKSQAEPLPAVLKPTRLNEFFLKENPNLKVYNQDSKAMHEYEARVEKALKEFQQQQGVPHPKGDSYQPIWTSLAQMIAHTQDRLYKIHSEELAKDRYIESFFMEGPPGTPGSLFHCRDMTCATLAEKLLGESIATIKRLEMSRLADVQLHQEASLTQRRAHLSNPDTDILGYRKMILVEHLGHITYLSPEQAVYFMRYTVQLLAAYKLGGVMYTLSQDQSSPWFKPQKMECYWTLSEALNGLFQSYAHIMEATHKLVANEQKDAKPENISEFSFTTVIDCLAVCRVALYEYQELHMEERALVKPEILAVVQAVFAVQEVLSQSNADFWDFLPINIMHGRINMFMDALHVWFYECETRQLVRSPTMSGETPSVATYADARNFCASNCKYPSSCILSKQAKVVSFKVSPNEPAIQQSMCFFRTMMKMGTNYSTWIHESEENWTKAYNAFGYEFKVPYDLYAIEHVVLIGMLPDGTMIKNHPFIMRNTLKLCRYVYHLVTGTACEEYMVRDHQRVRFTANGIDSFKSFLKSPVPTGLTDEVMNKEQENLYKKRRYDEYREFILLMFHDKFVKSESDSSEWNPSYYMNIFDKLMFAHGNLCAYDGTDYDCTALLLDDGMADLVEYPHYTKDVHESMNQLQLDSQVVVQDGQQIAVAASVE